MKRDVQTSELVFLGLLILIAAYIFMVQIPISNQMQELEDRQATLQNEIVTLQSKIKSQATMKAAVEKAFEDAHGSPREIPKYNNISNVTFELHSIFEDTQHYVITFGAEKRDKNIIRRDISISFSAASYEMMRSKLLAISESPNMYLITSMNIGMNSAKQEYSVSMTLVNFEYEANAK